MTLFRNSKNICNFQDGFIYTILNNGIKDIFSLYVFQIKNNYYNKYFISIQYHWLSFTLLKLRVTILE